MENQFDYENWVQGVYACIPSGEACISEAKAGPRRARMGCTPVTPLSAASRDFITS